MDPEAIRAHPLERFLLPLDLNPQPRESQALTSILSGLVIRAADRREASVPIEPVRIGHKRPQLLGGGAKPPFPPIVELWVAHLDLLLLPSSLLRTVHSCNHSVRAL